MPRSPTLFAHSISLWRACAPHFQTISAGDPTLAADAMPSKAGSAQPETDFWMPAAPFSILRRRHPLHLFQPAATTSARNGARRVLVACTSATGGRAAFAPLFGRLGLEIEYVTVAVGHRRAPSRRWPRRPPLR